MGTDGNVILKIDSDAAPLTAIERLNDDGITDLVGRGYGALLVGDADRPGNWKATVPQQAARQFFVRRDLRRDKAVSGNVRSPDALLESAVSELHQREPAACSASRAHASSILIKVFHRNAARFGFFSQHARIDPKR